MENDLVSIYENNYIRGSLIQENKKEETSSDEDEGQDDSPESSKSKKFMKNKKSKKTVNPGAIYADSFKKSENIFDKILKEMDEMGGDFGSSDSEDTGDTFDTSEDVGEVGEDEQTFTLSELKSMTLSELATILSGGETEEDEDYSFEDEGFEDEGFEDGEEIPSESYGFSGGEGNYKGDQGNYDGKAKKQPATDLVKGNGDANFGKSKTGYDPDDTEGSEGEHMGDQGNYDGKAKKQPATDLVKGNGDANFGKAKLNYKTKSGKKEKNYF